MNIKCSYRKGFSDNNDFAQDNITLKVNSNFVHIRRVRVLKFTLVDIIPQTKDFMQLPILICKYLPVKFSIAFKCICVYKKF